MLVRVIQGAVVLTPLFMTCDPPVDREASNRPPDNHEKVTIAQGVWGNVWFWEGDFMPTTDPGGHGGTITPVVRTVLVYELTSLAQVDQVSYSPFYRAIRTTFVDSTRSDASGFFQLALHPGQFSLFVREDSMYYANGFDGVGNIVPVTIPQDSVRQVQLDITYKATY